ncbi:lactonase family protein [Cellvibrio sp. pealriver]|uniref:lactonase family protein n=1 Tax=Cellvibrio sp. pealriver TaxID=1622269 RepID=UPI00066FB323|nr:lactonase family protein [Cellvibrio sp. pealriver]
MASATTTSATIASATTAVYIANSDSHSLSVFWLDEQTGKAALQQTLAVRGAVMPLRLSHNKRLLYAAIRSEPYRVAVFDIDPHTGYLTARTSIPLPDSMANIDLDRAGRYLLSASYGGNSISIQPLDSEGIPAAQAQVIKTGAHPHQITADPENQFIYVSLLGENRLDYFRLGDETPHTTALELPAGSGPRHFVFSKQKKRVYVLSELSAQVQVAARDPSTGVLRLRESHSLLPAGNAPWAADIHLTPDEHFLYVSERNSNSLFGFRVDQQSGRLRALGKWTTEHQPRAFTISESGRYLLVVGQKSHHLQVFAINPATGALTVTERKATGNNPSWVETLALKARSNKPEVQNE